MMEVWSVIGFTILSKDLHEKLHAAAILGHDFDQIKIFRDILRVKMRLNLSRAEIMLLHRTITERHIHITLPAQPIPRPEEDPDIIPIREGWTGPVPAFPNDFHLCAVVGLASIDITFRKALHDQSDANPAVGIVKLDAFLRTPTGESPIFELTEANRFNLNAFLRAKSDTMNALLEAFHISRWVQPSSFPCDGGYTDTPDVKYLYFPQPALIKLIYARPELAGFLQGIELPGFLQGIEVPEIEA